MITDVFLFVFERSVSASLAVILLVMLAPFLNRHYAAKWRYYIWIFLAFWLVIPFYGGNGKSATVQTEAVSQHKEKQTDTLVNNHTLSRRIVVTFPQQMTTPVIAKREKKVSSVTLLDLVAYLWITVAAANLFFNMISYLHYKRQLQKDGVYLTDWQILKQMRLLSEELRIKNHIPVIGYTKATSPMIIGLLKPVLVLPKEKYSTEELFFVLKHELVHLKRRDVYFKFLIAAVSALHWFNPFIWLMQKEAVVDMELSCDERVIQGTKFETRKAYTETLFSTLHRKYKRTTIFSTQFYGGKQIMKRRFKNILFKGKKKNGMALLVCAVVLTASLGTLIGCAAAKPQEQKESKEKKQEIKVKQLSQEQNTEADDTKYLTFSAEGEEEKKAASLVEGDGYVLYLPDGEWKQTDYNTWTSEVNDKVQIWVERFENRTAERIETALKNNGYQLENNELVFKENTMVYKAKLTVNDNGVWSVFYSYPEEAEEGWGVRLPVIVNTLQVK